MILDNLKELFKSGPAAGEGGEDKAPLSEAVCAVLVETASADGEFTSDEKDLIASFMEKSFSMSREDSAVLMETITRSLEDETNKWKYTNIINSSMENSEKEELLEYIWRIIFSDGRIEKWEDNIVHRLSKNLHIPHHLMIGIKMKVKESLGE